jgi:internalin A
LASREQKKAASEAVQLFYSYCHKDEILRKELEVRLSRLQRDGKIAGWHDRRIDPGDDLEKRIDENLDKADVILLLVSDDFLASDACDREMKQALERRRRGEAKVIPVILRPSDWLRTPLQGLLALPQDGKPVTQWRDRDSAWRNVSEGIERIVQQMRSEGREGRTG